MPILTTATAATMAPRVEIFTQLACIAYKEKYPVEDGNKTINMLLNASTALGGGLSDGMVCARNRIASLNMQNSRQGILRKGARCPCCSSTTQYAVVPVIGHSKLYDCGMVGLRMFS
jgi:hypothetical protein